MDRATSFATELDFAVPRDVVWDALTQPAGRRHWMNDAEVASTWAPGADIAIEVELEGRVRQDRGTVEVADRPDALRYSLWSSISRRPDRPEHRSTVTFRLTPTERGGTHLTLVHEALGTATAVPHARFFWPVALAILRHTLEGRSPAGLDLRTLGG